MHFYFDMINLRENIAPATGQLFFQNDVQYLKQKKIFKTRFEKIWDFRRRKEHEQYFYQYLVT